MNAETWMNAHKAVELGFADKIMFTDAERQDNNDTKNKNGASNKNNGVIFSRMAVTNSLLNKLPKPPKPEPSAPPTLTTGTPIESLEKRLSLIYH